MRILYIQANVTPPPRKLSMDRFQLLSSTLEGDVLQPAWYFTGEEIERDYGPGSYPVYTVGGFRYHWFPCSMYKGAARRRAIFHFYLRKGLELVRQNRYDAIVAYAHQTTALIGILLKWVGRSKLAIEIATSPEYVYITESPQPTPKQRLMHWYSTLTLHITCWLSDHTHLLSPGQLRAFPLLRRTTGTVFHEFVCVASVPKQIAAPKPATILLVGAPWFLKGADLLIAAYRELVPEFPDLRLQILGHYPDGDPLRKLADGLPNCEILKPRMHPEVLEIISQASVVVLASRCEGMGRVLLEAMAAGIPVVGSDIGGIPHMIRDGHDGFLFPREDSHALADRLRTILRDPELHRRLGQNAYNRAHSEFSEAVYAQKFTEFVEATVRGTGTPPE
jgi:glycosyltransferase involved in cell wall biosynthesis